MRKTLPALLLPALLAAAQAASAQEFRLPPPRSPFTGAGVPVGGGTRVVGDSSSGSIAQPGDVRSAASFTIDQINNEVERVGQALALGQQQQLSGIARLFEDQNRKLRDLFVGFGASQARVEAERTFGDRAQPLAACAAPALGAGARESAAEAAAIEARLMAEMGRHARAFESANEQNVRIAELPPQAFDIDTLLPPGGTRAPGREEAVAELVANMTDPAPPVNLAPSAQERLPARYYEGFRRMREAWLGPAQRTLSALAASRAPTAELSGFARRAWESMGGEGEPPGLVDGQISESALLDLLVAVRYRNESWYRNLAAEELAGVLREMALMDSVRLELERRRLRIAELRAAMHAQRAALGARRATESMLARWRSLVSGEAGEAIGTGADAGAAPEEAVP